MGDCWQSGGPNWLFPIIFAGPLLGVSLGVLWLLIVLLSMPPAATQAKGSLRIPPPLVHLILVGMIVFTGARALSSEDSGFGGTVVPWSYVAVTLIAAVPLAIFAPRLTATPPDVAPRWRALRVIPWPVRFALPTLALGGCIIGPAAFASTIALGSAC
jgi:hypothetical protein